MRKPTFVLAILALAASATYCKADTITGVTFTGTPANPMITITGSGFGTAPTGTAVPPTGYSGLNFGNSLYFTDLSSGFTAGFSSTSGSDYIGLTLDSYTNSSITFGLGSFYSAFYPGTFNVASGNNFNVDVAGTMYSGTVNYTTSSVTPEPSSLLLLGTGALGLLGAARRRFA